MAARISDVRGMSRSTAEARRYSTNISGSPSAEMAIPRLGSRRMAAASRPTAATAIVTRNGVRDLVGNCGNNELVR